MTTSQPMVLDADENVSDGWDDPQKGRLGWRTLFSSDLTPTDGLTAGVAIVEPGGWLGLHRHDPAEIYYVLEGSGTVTIDGRDHPIAAGSAVFIPGNADHGARNTGSTVLRFLYAFPVDSFGDVEYRFTDTSSGTA